MLCNNHCSKRIEFSSQYSNAKEKTKKNAQTFTQHWPIAFVCTNTRIQRTMYRRTLGRYSLSRHAGVFLLGTIDLGEEKRSAYAEQECYEDFEGEKV